MTRLCESGTAAELRSSHSLQGATEMLISASKSDSVRDLWAPSVSVVAFINDLGTAMRNWKSYALFTLTVFIFAGASSEPASGQAEKRRQYFEQLKHILPPNKPWEAQLAKTGDLPPDFDTLASIPNLPDPLIDVTGDRSAPITTRAGWERQRDRLKAEFERWVVGHAPPRPARIEARTISERQASGCAVRDVELAFGESGRPQARLRLKLLIPAGQGRFPVFMTQEETRDWAHVALRRGYLACVYSTSDTDDNTDTFVDAYPDADWGRLMRRAWATGVAIDYLNTVPQADTQRVALSGHSRYGKQSVIAAAFDERIKVVISSSSGSGGVLPARYTSEFEFAEGIETITRSFPDWFNPRFRFFSGREHKLPVDFHELVALVAPRACLLSIALNDGVESSWAMQQTYLAAKPVYRLLGAEQALRILWRQGGHELWPGVMERYFDWCDNFLRRARYPFEERFVNPWNWEAWKARLGQADVSGFKPNQLDDLLLLKNGARISSAGEWEQKKQEIRSAIGWLLGLGPPRAGNLGDYGNMYNLVTRYLVSGSEDHLRRRGLPKGVVQERVADPKLKDTAVQLSTSVGFGEFLSGDIYVPAGTAESGSKMPAVLWLSSFSFPRGYTAAYRDRRGEQPYHALAGAGYAVFCIDHIGMSRRIEESEGFYDRYPDWSLLGRMVRDSQDALDAMEAMPYVDAKRIYVVGYGLGAMIATHLGALDDRPAGFVIASPPQPFRLDTHDKATGGIARWAKLHMLVPRLGFFEGRETLVPYDLHSLMGALAPRPTLVISPKLDWRSKIEDVTRALEAAKKVYALHGAEALLEQVSPEAFNDFNIEKQRIVLDWLKNR